MKIVSVEESIGMVLCQDITRIVPGEFKGVLFKKGHIVREEDIEALLKVGKEHLYVWDPELGDVHENDAAIRIAKAVCGENIHYDENPKEGKCGLTAKIRGLFKVDSEKLIDINSVEYVTVATLPGNYHVEAGAKLGGARVVPLAVKAAVLDEVEGFCQDGPIIDVVPYKNLKCGIVTTGSEVFKGRIEDKFGPVMREKIAFHDSQCLGQTICPDDKDTILQAIQDYKDQGADLIILTGGMSVDPDDVTPSAIRSTGASVISYGAPAQPGNMLMLAYWDETALIGVPGCAMFFETTVLDIILSHVFIGEKLSKRDFARLGEGGFCQGCEICRYPHCYFGRK
ncbi:MAG: molybdopterin-binding protein [Clostridiales bacterium]